VSENAGTVNNASTAMNVVVCVSVLIVPPKVVLEALQFSYRAGSSNEESECDGDNQDGR
jgi:hypothetical protein